MLVYEPLFHNPDYTLSKMGLFMLVDAVQEKLWSKYSREIFIFSRKNTMSKIQISNNFPSYISNNISTLNDA